MEDGGAAARKERYTDDDPQRASRKQEAKGRGDVMDALEGDLRAALALLGKVVTERAQAISQVALEEAWREAKAGLAGPGTPSGGPEVQRASEELVHTCKTSVTGLTALVREAFDAGFQHFQEHTNWLHAAHVEGAVWHYLSNPYGSIRSPLPCPALPLSQRGTFEVVFAPHPRSLGRHARRSS